MIFQQAILEKFWIITHALEIYTVEFVIDDSSRIVEASLEREDIDLFEKGDEATAEAKQNAATQFVMEKLQEVFENMDKYKVKDGVDSMGIKKYIKHCANLAAATGVATGAFGPISLIGMPIDIINNIVQQFRVTLAVIYEKTGQYKVSWEYFAKIVGVSVGVEVGATVGKVVLLQIAKAIMMRLAAGGFGRLIPIVGGGVVGGVNYAFIRSIGAALMKMDIK